MQNINDTLYDAFGQRQVSTIYAQTNQYRVVLEAQPRYLADPTSLKNLYVSSDVAAQVPLSTFTTLKHDTAPLSVQHTEQFPAVTISFNLEEGESLSDAVQAIADASKAIGMPASITGTFAGDAAEFASSLQNEPYLILAAAITIYIVLGVLYESAIHPITILSTLPSAGVGALLALMAFRMDLSLIALIGIVLLMGIVKKNAIMIIDFALDAEREQGMTPHEAIIQASVLRFPPDHDDDDGGAARRAAAGGGDRHRLGVAQPARHLDRRRAASEPAHHALHDAGDLRGAGAPALPPLRPRESRRPRGATCRRNTSTAGPPNERGDVAQHPPSPAKRGEGGLDPKWWSGGGGRRFHPGRLLASRTTV